MFKWLTHANRKSGDQFGFKNHAYLDPGKSGRSEKSSAIMAPIAHMSENMIVNKHINKMARINLLSGFQVKATNIFSLTNCCIVNSSL